jgi:hypothetical protein
MEFATAFPGRALVFAMPDGVLFPPIGRGCDDVMFHGVAVPLRERLYFAFHPIGFADPARPANSGKLGVPLYLLYLAAIA